MEGTSGNTEAAGRPAVRAARLATSAFEIVEPFVVMDHDGGKLGQVLVQELHVLFEAQVCLVQGFDNGGHGAFELFEFLALLDTLLFALPLGLSERLQALACEGQGPLDALPTLFG